MNKIIKIIITIIISIILIYTLFVTEESIRLKKEERKPLIILNGTCDINEMPYDNYFEITCRSIGFKIKRRYEYEARAESDVRIGYITKAEFWLFDKFLIWGWIS